jgi:hypothetical protein
LPPRASYVWHLVPKGCQPAQAGSGQRFRHHGFRRGLCGEKSLFPSESAESAQDSGDRRGGKKPDGWRGTDGRRIASSWIDTGRIDTSWIDTSWIDTAGPDTVTFPPIALQVVLAIIAGLAAIYDLRYRRIPNWIVLTGLVLGIGLNAFLFEWAGVRQSLLGLGLAFVIYFPLYLLRGMGGIYRRMGRLAGNLFPDCDCGRGGGGRITRQPESVTPRIFQCWFSCSSTTFVPASVRAQRGTGHPEREVRQASSWHHDCMGMLVVSRRCLDLGAPLKKIRISAD